MDHRPPEDIEIRPTTGHDFEIVEAFIHPFVDEKILLPRTTDELAELLNSGYVAEHADSIVGFAALEVYSAKLAEVRSLAVASSHQGLGIGRRLVEACVMMARERDILEVMAITSTEAFFKSCGFEFTLPGEKKALFIQTREH